MLSQPCRNVQRGFQALCVRIDPAQPGAELPLEQHGGDDALASRKEGEVAGGGGGFKTFELGDTVSGRLRM